MNEPKKKIERALHQFANGNLADNAKHLLNVLGYEERTNQCVIRPKYGGEDFCEEFNLEDPERRILSPDTSAYKGMGIG